MSDLAELSSGLEVFLGTEVHGLRRLSGGASRDTYAFEADERPLVVQRVRPGALSASFSMVDEAALLRAALARGVPVAPVVDASDDPAFVGAPFVVVAQLDGETIARRVLRDDEFASARAVLVAQSGAALAGIHAIPPADVASLDEQPQLDQLRGLADVLGESMGVHPAFELAFRWLGRNAPPLRPVGVVHGDYRLGNLLVGSDGLEAVLDWELAHLGDPLEDLGWFTIRAWRFGGEAEVAGLATIDELVGAYEAAGGMTVDRDALRWWQVLSTLRWGVICMLQASTHLSGASRSVELAAIGRRVCETEYDVLELLP